MSARESSLQLRVASVFMLLALAFSVGSYIALQGMIFPVFAQIEQEEAEEDITRVKQLLEAELDAVAAVGRRYSQSTDAWRFLRGDNPAFPERTLHPDRWRDVDVELMFFFDPEGELIWGKTVDPGTGELIVVHELSVRPASRGRGFIRRNRELGDVQGIVEGQRGILLAALQPVTRFDGSGEPAGYFLIGRFLTSERRDEYGDRIGVTFSLVPAMDIEPSAERDAAERDDRFFPSHPIEYSYEEQSVVSQQIIRDAFKQYTLKLEARTPSIITGMGSAIQKLSFAFLTIMSSLFILLSWFTIRWLVIDPVHRLKTHMKAIRSSGDLALALGWQRKDELGSLADELDYMTGELRQAHQRLESARDEALALAHRKSEFLASMSHEIRTPMNGVLGITELLLKTEIAQEQRQLDDTIRTSATSLVNVINDILDFSQIGTGRVRLVERVFTITQLVREVNAVVAEAAHAKGLEYITVENEPLPAEIVADDRRLRQVLINLLVNAVKFTPSGQVVLSIASEERWHEDGSEKSRLRFTVTDTGIGIDRQLQDTLFDREGQGDRSTTREFSGTGLGLTISKHIVELMGGDIGVQSKPGDGSTFWFTVPVTINSDGRQPIAKPSVCTGELAGKHVLVVDDNATQRELLLEHVQGWGAHADAVSGSAEAVEQLEQRVRSSEPYDIVILDYPMPKTGDAELARTIADQPRYGQPATIILGSLAKELPCEDLAANGTAAYLVKPVLKEDLYAKILTELNSRTGLTVAADYIEGKQDKPCERPALDARVLVAEDNLVNQQVTYMVLRNYGCECHLVGNGQEALHALQNSKYDLVIMDCQMPVMDGFEATAAIREAGHTAVSGGHLPILALTANVMEGDQERCFDVGMDRYIAKPFDSETLAQVICELIGLENAMTDNNETKLDEEVLERVRAMQREGQPDILTRLIDVYLESSSGLIETLDTALSANDIAAVEMTAHTLKSSSANLGAQHYAALCADLEQAARDNDTATIESLGKKIIDAFDDVCEALRKERIE